MSNHRTLPYLLLLLGWTLSVVPGGAAAAADGGSGPADPAPVLSVREALTLGVRNNLDLRIEEIAVPIRRDDVRAAEAAFDPAVDASADAQTRSTPLGVRAGDDTELLRGAGAGAGISKRFHSGLATRLGLETQRASGDLPGSLDPEYRSLLVLDLTQPLLRDRGTDVNTADIRTSENRVRQATYAALDRAQRLAEEVEATYLELALSQEVLSLRRRSRELARELADGNREKLEAGTVPITEVQQAETAVAARDELVLAARQNVEVARTVLLDLLNVNAGDPLYGVEVRAEPLPAIDSPESDGSGDPGEALGVAWKSRPDLKAQRVEIANRDIRLAFYGNQTLPRLDLAATLGVNGLSGSGSGSNEGPYGESWSRTAAGDGYEWFAGVRFSYPLGNRAAEARRRQAGLQKSQEIHRLKRLERTVETEVQTALVAVRRSLDRYRVAERFVSLARLTLEQEQERLREGLSDTFRVLDLQDDLIEAEVRRSTALADYHKGLARLYRAMGANLERYDIVYEMDTEEKPHV